MKPNEVYYSLADAIKIRKPDSEPTQNAISTLSLRPQPLKLSSTPDTFVEEPWRDFQKIDQAYKDASGEYKYQRIQGPNSIRLLEIPPGLPSEIIRLQVFEASLDSNPEYDALSYEWCLPFKKTSRIDNINVEFESRFWYHILCDGKQMSIMKNLHKALLKLRHPSKTMVIWADGICINQKDETEKPGQLMLMGRIYSQARTVLCWIGEEKADTRNAFRVISSIAASFHSKNKEAREDISVRKNKTREHPRIRSSISTLFHPKKKASQDDSNARVNLGPEISIDQDLVDEMQGDAWLAVVDVFTRPYFGRIWVVQEVVLAKQATIICGTNRIPWFDFLNVSKVCAAVGIKIYRRVEDLDEKREKGDEPDYVKHMKVEDVVDQTGEEVDLFTSKWFRVIGIGNLQDAQSDGTRSLVLCLEQLIGHQVTNPRDRVYGMLGMITPISDYSKRRPIKPSYLKTIQQVYQDATVWAIQDLASLRILDLCEAPGTNVTEGLPTWVPDLSKGSAQCQINDDPKLTGSLLSIFSHHFIGLPAHSRLYAQGHIVDTIVVARAPFTFSLKPIFMMQHFKENAYRELEQREPIYPTGCTKLEAFWRTLIANRIEDKSENKLKILKPPPGFDKHFMKYNAREFISNWGLPLNLTGKERDLWELRLDEAPFPLEEMFPEEVCENMSILALMERQPFVKWMYRCAKEGDEALWGAEVNHRRWLCNGEYGRQFFFSEKGWMGIGHPCQVLNVGSGNVDVAEGTGVKAGDVIAVLNGSDKVWILRNDGAGCFAIVGQAYVYGISGGLGVDVKSLPEFRSIMLR